MSYTPWSLLISKCLEGCVTLFRIVLFDALKTHQNKWDVNASQCKRQSSPLGHMNLTFCELKLTFLRLPPLPRYFICHLCNWHQLHLSALLKWFVRGVFSWNYLQYFSWNNFQHPWPRLSSKVTKFHEKCTKNNIQWLLPHWVFCSNSAGACISNVMRSSSWLLAVPSESGPPGRNGTTEIQCLNICCF